MLAQMPSGLLISHLANAKSAMSMANAVSTKAVARRDVSNARSATAACVKSERRAPSLALDVCLRPPPSVGGGRRRPRPTQDRRFLTCGPGTGALSIYRSHHTGLRVPDSPRPGARRPYLLARTHSGPISIEVCIDKPDVPPLTASTHGLDQSGRKPIADAPADLAQCPGATGSYKWHVAHDAGTYR